MKDTGMSPARRGQAVGALAFADELIEWLIGHWYAPPAAMVAFLVPRLRRLRRAIVSERRGYPQRRAGNASRPV